MVQPIQGPIAPTPETQEITLLLVALGSFFVLFGYFSHIVRGRFFIPSSVLATLFGIALGPKGAGLIITPGGSFVDGKSSDDARYFLLNGTRIVLGIQVLSAGLELPCRYLRHRNNAASFLTLLFPNMIVSWLVSSSFVYALLPSLWYEALVIGACLTPTDPVLAGSVIKGHFASRHVSKDIRDVLLAESGANDGLGSPFLYLALSFIFTTYKTPPEGAPTTTFGLMSQFVVSVLLYNVLLSIALGIATGYVLREVLQLCQRRRWIDEESMLCFSVAVSIFLVGVASMLDTNQLLCCFVAGIVLNWQDGMGEVIRTPFAEGVDNIMDIVIFTVMGAVLPFDTWVRYGKGSTKLWRTIVVGIFVMLFRRLPSVMLFSKGLRSISTFGQTMFVGWFGPIGVGALYYALEATDKMPGQTELHVRIYSTVSFVIFLSIFVHGLSIPFFLLLTSCFPQLAPALLGKGKQVKQDFIAQEFYHPHDDEDIEAGDTSNNERSPLIPHK